MFTSTKHSLLLLGAAWLLLGASPTTGSLAARQDDPFAPQSGDISYSTSFMPAPREVYRPLSRAKKALASGQVNRAIELLGEILGSENVDDYFVLVENRTDLVVSLRSQANQLLSQLSAQDLESYELRFGVIARKNLSTAISAGDYQGIAQVARRFLYTNAGMNATMMMGHQNLEHGRTIAAASDFQRVYDHIPARDYHDPALSVMLATSWLLSNKPDRAGQVLTDLKKRQPGARVGFMGRQVSLYGESQEPIAWLKDLIGTSALAENRIVREWLVYRGNTERNAVGQSGFPLRSPRWSAPTFNDPDQEKVATDILDKLVSDHASTIPSIQPLVVGDTVIARSFQKVIGINFRTGKRTWIYPPWEGDLLHTDEEIVHDSLRTKRNRDPIAERMWQDAVYGQCSSDGQSVFLIPFPGVVGQNGVKVFWNKDVIVKDPMGSRKFNELVSLDVAREGFFRWEVGGESGLDEPELAGVQFQGPPLPLNGSLYAIVHQKGEVRLVVLDAKTGQHQWSQQLARLDFGRRNRQRNERRLAGATPSFSNGVLVCPTGVKSLVAIDLASRALLWGYQYKHPQLSRSNRIRSNPLRISLSQYDRNWRDSTVVIQGDVVVYPAIDSESLVCVNLLTGEPLWSKDMKRAARESSSRIRSGRSTLIPTDRDDALYVASVEKDAICLVGLDHVRAIKLNNGSALWETELKEYGHPSGRGYVADGHYFLPTTNRKIVKINLANGAIVDSVSTPQILGNLICYRGEVVSFGVSELATYPQDEPTLNRIQIAETKGGVNGNLLGLKAQLLQQQGNLVDAVKTVAQAYKQTNSIRHRELMLDLHLELLRSDFNKGRELAEPFEDLLIDTRRDEYLMTQIDMFLQSGDFPKASDTLLSMLEPPNDFDQWHDQVVKLAAIDDQNFGRELDSPDIMLGHWFRIRMDHVLKHCDRSKLQNNLEALTERLQAGTPLRADKFCSLFPTDVVPSDFQFELVKRLRESLHFLRAESLLKRLQLAANSIVRLRATYELAQFYTAHEMRASAAVQIDILKTEFANERGPVGKNGVELANELLELPTFPQVTTTVFDFNAAHSQIVPVQDIRRYLPLNSIKYIGKDPRFEKLVFRHYRITGEIEILDENGSSIRRFRTRTNQSTSTRAQQSPFIGRVRSDGNVLVFDVGHDVVAVDWMSVVAGANPVLWFKQLQNSVALRRTSGRTVWGELASASSKEVVSVTRPINGYVCVHEKNRLICIDVLSGATIWSRPSLIKSGQLFASADRVALWDAGNREVKLYHLTSGQRLKTAKLPDSHEIRGFVKGCLLISRADKQAIRLLAKPDMEPQAWVLKDVLRNEDIWTRQFPGMTTAHIMNDGRIAVLRQSGDLEFINASTGETDLGSRLDLGLEQGQHIVSVEVSRIQQGLLVKTYVASNTSIDRDALPRDAGNGNTLQKIVHFERSWNGYVTVLNPETGTSKWKRPARVEHFQFFAEQPFASPAIVLGRVVSRRLRSPSHRSVQQFVVLDARNGHWLTTGLGLGQALRNYRIRLDPQRHRLSLTFGGNHLLVKFENQSGRPPVPVASLTDENTSTLGPEEVEFDEVDPIQVEAETLRLLEKVRAEDAKIQALRKKIKLRAQNKRVPK